MTTIEIDSSRVIVSLWTQLLLDIFVNGARNFSVRNSDLRDVDVRALRLVSFEKLRLTPRDRIESKF